MSDTGESRIRHLSQLGLLTGLTLRRNLYDLRYAVTVALILGLSIVGAVLSDSHARHRQAEFDGLSRAFAEQANLESVRLARPPSPLLFLSSGAEDRLPAYLIVTPDLVDFPIEELTSARVAVPFLRLDWVFVVVYLLGVLCLLLTYDFIAGQREAGTLSLLFASAVTRPIIVLGGLAGALLAIVPCLAATLFIFLAPPLLGGMLTPSPETLARLAMLLTLGLAFLTVNGLIGLLSSSLFRRPVTSLAFAFVTWTILTAGVPLAANLAGRIARPVGSARALESQVGGIRSEYFSRVRSFSSMEILERIRRPDLTRSEKERAVNALRSEIESVNARARAWFRSALKNLRIEQLNRRSQQRRLVTLISTMSPSEVFRLASEALCGTGVDQFEAFQRRAEEYQEVYSQVVEQLRAQLRSKAREIGATIEESGFQVKGVIWLDYGEVNVGLGRLPRPEREVYSFEGMRSAAVYLSLLLAAAGVLFFLTFWSISAVSVS